MKNSKVPHVILVFKGTSIEKIKRNRPSIEGVSLGLLKFLGNHKEVQKWDFIEWNGGVALLVPKRYVILSRGRIWSICLLFKEKD
ncbi:hypothetical protein KAT63_01550 [Candidatus Parcubacteria bacterium]|nr:hypothetical protein [Candidatus Parcubacteria bacterium]